MKQLSTRAADADINRIATIENVHEIAFTNQHAPNQRWV
ncbi:hypothetical protein SMETW2_47040 (plasmid) [Serratia marcescens]|nr:hypothetical protein SMETW2_47040 [Serratia marcescens]